jgi:GT2 family glycosyltransferase
MSKVAGLSLITVTHRSASSMPAFLAAARRAAPEGEIVVVDNASDDNTVEVVRQHDPTAAIVCCAENLGFGRGCNIGALHASGEWLLFLNPDLTLRCATLPRTEMNDGSLWSGVTVGNDGLHRSGLRADNSLAEDYCAQLFSHLLPPALSARIPIRRRPAGWTTGALFLTHRDAFSEVAGFDPRYFLYYEDRDLGTKYRRTGRPVRELTTLIGAHAHGQSSSDVSSACLEAWSLISWLEYIAKWRDQSTATRAATTILATFKHALRLSSARRRIQRAQRKAEHLREVLGHLERFEDLLPVSADGYYPYTRDTIRAATSQIAE